MPATGAMSRMKLKLSFVVKRRITRVRKTNQEKRVAIRGRIHDRLGGDVGTCTRPVLDDELLAVRSESH